MLRAAAAHLGCGSATSAGVVAAYLNRIKASAGTNAYISVADEALLAAAA